MTKEQQVMTSEQHIKNKKGSGSEQYGITEGSELGSTEREEVVWNSGWIDGLNLHPEWSDKRSSNPEWTGRRVPDPESVLKWILAKPSVQKAYQRFTGETNSFLAEVKKNDDDFKKLKPKQQQDDLYKNKYWPRNSDLKDFNAFAAIFNMETGDYESKFLNLPGKFDKDMPFWGIQKVDDQTYSIAEEITGEITSDEEFTKLFDSSFRGIQKIADQTYSITSLSDKAFTKLFDVPLHGIQKINDQTYSITSLSDEEFKEFKKVRGIKKATKIADQTYSITDLSDKAFTKLFETPFRGIQKTEDQTYSMTSPSDKVFTKLFDMPFRGIQKIGDQTYLITDFIESINKVYEDGNKLYKDKQLYGEDKKEGGLHKSVIALNKFFINSMRMPPGDNKLSSLFGAPALHAEVQAFNDFLKKGIGLAHGVIFTKRLVTNSLGQAGDDFPACFNCNALLSLVHVTTGRSAIHSAHADMVQKARQEMQEARGKQEVQEAESTLKLNQWLEEQSGNLDVESHEAVAMLPSDLRSAPW